MGMLKRAGDLVYTFRFLTLLVTKFEDTEAFKAGIIDAQGNRRKDFDDMMSANRAALQDYYTPFHRLVFNIKKLMAKAPGGASTIASYVAALYLIKEKYGVSEWYIERGLREIGLSPSDFVIEQNTWFVLADGRLSPGSYKIKRNMMLSSTLDEMVRAQDYIRAPKDCYPIGQLFGVNVYEAVHTRTNQPVYVTVEDLMV